MSNKEFENALQKVNVRNIIATTLVVLGAAGTLMLAIWLLVDDPDAKSFIGQSLLPLWGTWVGTVLAYYFGKENFEAASKSYQEVIKSMTPDQKIAGIRISDAMIPIEKIKYMEFNEDCKKKTIVEIMNHEGFQNYQRIAFLTSDKILKYMIHKSTLAMFISESLDNDPKTLTLNDLLAYNKEDSKIPNMLKHGYAFVSINSNMLAAKVLMDAIPACQDIFVTETGKEDEPISGLITNNQILEKCRI